MNVLRNSRLEGDNTFVRISKMMSIFLGKALRVMMNSQHILYEKVNIFFLQRPALELDDVPMFYTLSNSGEYFEEEVDWLLGILTAGLDDDAVCLMNVIADSRSYNRLNVGMSWSLFSDCTAREQGDTKQGNHAYRENYKRFWLKRWKLDI